MDHPTTPAQISAAINDYLMSHAGALPEAARARLAAATSELAWLPRTVKTCEALYASAADLDPAGRTLCAQIACFCAQYNFHGMAIGDRGLRIVQAMRRMNGDQLPPGSVWPDEAEDPPVHSDYAPTPVPTPWPAPTGGAA